MKTVGYINEQGKYIKGSDAAMGSDRNTMYRSWSHDQQRKEFAKEILQPRVGGKPSKAFIEAYPEYSKKYFDQATIDRTLRSQP